MDNSSKRSAANLLVDSGWSIFEFGGTRKRRRVGIEKLTFRGIAAHNPNLLDVDYLLVLNGNAAGVVFEADYLSDLSVHQIISRNYATNLLCASMKVYLFCGELPFVFVICQSGIHFLSHPQKVGEVKSVQTIPCPDELATIISEFRGSAMTTMSRPFVKPSFCQCADGWRTNRYGGKWFAQGECRYCRAERARPLSKW